MVCHAQYEKRLFFSRGKGPRQHVGLSLNKADLKFPGSKPAKKQSIILIVSPTYLGKTTDDEDYWDWIEHSTL